MLSASYLWKGEGGLEIGLGERGVRPYCAAIGVQSDNNLPFLSCCLLAVEHAFLPIRPGRGRVSYAVRAPGPGRDGTRVRGVATSVSQSSPVRRSPIRRARRPLLLVATGFVLVIGLVLGDWLQAKREMDHLVTAVVVSRTAIVAGYLLVNPSMQDSGGDTASRAIETKCATAAADVQDTGALVSEVFVLPWHRSLGTAQDAYLAHSKTWQNKFTACADDVSRWADGSTTAQILASGRVAHRAFINALPMADGSNRIRIETLFKD